MKVVAAFDSFKGSLGSRAAGEAARAGVLAVAPGAEVVVMPVADGGEGTTDALLAALPGREVRMLVPDARGRPVETAWTLLDDGTAVVEAARAIGLAGAAPVDTTLPPAASSAGLGVLLAAALASGAERVLVGLGGTATTDGGAGLLAALAGTSAPPGNPLWAGPLPQLDLPDLRRVEVLLDVTSPLLGPTGAARLFGPQKGADAGQVAHLEQRMGEWAALLARWSGRDVAVLPGAGAAGGLGAALLACGATPRPGFATVAALTGLADRIRSADLVLTGEGALDAQTALGKGPAGVAALAQAAGVPVVALAGRLDAVPPGLFDAALGIHDVSLPLAEALDPGVTTRAIARTAGRVVLGQAAVKKDRIRSTPSASASSPRA